MPFKQLGKDSDRPVASRVALVGPPNSLKTTAIVKTWPRQYQDRDTLVILSYPGEKGWETIPRDEPNLISLVWEVEDSTKPLTPTVVVREVESVTAQVLSGAYGKVATFAGDGAHKLYQWYFQQALAEKIANAPRDWDGNEETFVGPAYGQAHKDYGLYLTKILSSSVPYAVMTFWQGLDREDPLNLSKKAPRAYFPDLPGMMARNAVGEFSATLFSEVSKPEMSGLVRGSWITRIEGIHQGIGIKVNPDIAQKIPVRIPQHFGVLQRYMAGDAEGAKLLTAHLKSPRPVNSSATLLQSQASSITTDPAKEKTT